MEDYICGRKVIHVMKDGTKRHNVNGLVVPCTGPTELAYKVLLRVEKKLNKKEGQVIETC